MSKSVGPALLFENPFDRARDSHYDLPVAINLMGSYDRMAWGLGVDAETGTWRDLDAKAVDYIVDWAREAPADVPLGMVLHLGQESSTAGDAAVLSDAVHEYFRLRALATRGQLRRLFRVGRISLVIGLAVLATSIVLAEFVAGLIDKESYAWLAQESLVIGGWVALWRPLEIPGSGDSRVAGDPIPVELAGKVLSGLYRVLPGAFRWRGTTYGNPDDGLFVAGANPWNPSRAVYCFVANSPLQLWQMTKRYQALPAWGLFKGEQVVGRGFSAHPAGASSPE